MHTHMHARTHTYTQKAKPLASAKWSRRPSEVPEVLWASAGKFIRGRASTPQVGQYHAQGDGVGTWNPIWTTPISRHGQQFDICFPSYHQAPIDVTAGWAASPVYARSQFNSWVSWSNMRNVSSKEITKVSWVGIKPTTFRLAGQYPDHLAMLPLTHAHTCGHTQAHTHTRADTHKHARALSYAPTHTRTNTRTHAHTCTCMHRHTRTNTHRETHHLLLWCSCLSCSLLTVTELAAWASVADS